MSNTINHNFQIFLSMQCNFCYEVAEKVFLINSDHFWNKWLRCDNNMITFLAMLDSSNKEKMFNWGTTLVSVVTIL